MNRIFDGNPLPEISPDFEYDCCKGCFMLLYRNYTKEAFDNDCRKKADYGFRLYSENTIKNNCYRTYLGKIVVHIYFCEAEKEMRLIADPNTNLFSAVPENCADICPECEEKCSNCCDEF